MSDSEYVTVGQAREMLGYTKDKMTRLIKKGVFVTIINIHDEREKLILRSDIEKRLLEGKPHKQAPIKEAE